MTTSECYVWTLGAMAALIRVGRPLCPLALTPEGRTEFDGLMASGLSPSDEEITNCIMDNKPALGLESDSPISCAEAIHMLKAFRDKVSSRTVYLAVARDCPDETIVGIFSDPERALQVTLHVENNTDVEAFVRPMLLDPQEDDLVWWARAIRRPPGVNMGKN